MMFAIALGVMMLSAPVEPPAPIGPLPNRNQLDWHAHQYYAFVHFGPNTFTGREWGDGRELPSVFAPTALDCRQWARVFREAGMTGVILTVKHHDGFALYPSVHTAHSVQASTWRKGQGDVLRELSEACRDEGLWLGVYLSPWDRNHPTYGTHEYNQVFARMLREVLTGYGEILEVWFDGANGEGPNGRRQEYDWGLFERTVREHAPRAVIFHDGGDVRWVGNEAGFVGSTNWSFLPEGVMPGFTGDHLLLYEGDENGIRYSPAECDVSIRPGWFWRESENDQVKSLAQLQEIFYRSIGHGGNLLLNVPPDDRGLIHDRDIEALRQFRAWREHAFRHDLAREASATGTFRGNDARFHPRHLIDGDDRTYWALDDGNVSGFVTLTLPTSKTLEHVVLGEYLPLGQRVREFEVQVDGDVVAEGTTIGYRRIVRFAPREGRVVTIRVKDARACPVLSYVQVYGP